MLSRSAIRPRRQNSPRPAWKVADAFRQWLRGRSCACGGRNTNCGGKIIAAHVDYAGDKGMGTKVSDRFCIPLSWLCHTLQHNIGWPRFETQFLPEKALKLSEQFWAAWPARGKWEADQANGALS